jgi:hypothetical protein
MIPGAKALTQEKPHPACYGDEEEEKEEEEELKAWLPEEKERLMPWS